MLITLDRQQYKAIREQVERQAERPVLDVNIPSSPPLVLQVPKEHAMKFLEDSERQSGGGRPLHLKVVPPRFELISTATLAEAFEGVRDEGHIAIFDAGEYGKYMGDLSDHDIKMIGVYVSFGEEAAQQFEVAQKAFFFEQCCQRACETFLDIGANHGAYSVYAHLQRIFRQIHAFEPVERTFEYLRINLEILNHCDYATCHNFAVSNSDGIRDFSVLFNATGASGVTEDNAVMNLNPGIHPFITQRLEAKMLDNLLKNKGERMAAKIDVEGHELSVIDGMRALLVENNFFLQIESFERTRQALIENLDDLGYRLINQIHFDHYFEKKV